MNRRGFLKASIGISTAVAVPALVISDNLPIKKIHRYKPGRSEYLQWIGKGNISFNIGGAPIIAKKDIFTGDILTMDNRTGYVQPIAPSDNGLIYGISLERYKAGEVVNPARIISSSNKTASINMKDITLNGSSGIFI